MTTYQPCYRSMSLVERKKLQWAKEREELANLGIPFKQQSFERSRYGSKTSLITNDYSKEATKPERRSSLPPLYQNQYNSNCDYRQEKQEKKDKGGETSGYGSDSYPTPEYRDHRLPPADNGQWNGGQCGYESSTSCRDDRPKWGDKGVGVGKFWQPKQDHYEKRDTNEPPNWVKRGLEVEGAIVVANSSSPSLSPEQRGEENDRPYTGSSYSQHRSYIRGQNIPIDAAELAERERKRQLALEHQEAIRKQLEEREKKRQEERARQIREEREEELRIEREQEYDRQRKLAEERALQEKIKREQQRKEAIKQAIEAAEKEAKLQKMRSRMMKQSNNSHVEQNITENVVEKQKVPQTPDASQADDEPKLNNKREIINNSHHQKQDNNNLTNKINNNLPEASNPEPSRSESTTSVTNSVQPATNNERSLTPIIQTSPRTSANYAPRNEQFTYFFQPTLEGLPNIQYAVLIPTTLPQYHHHHHPMAIPVPLQAPKTERAVECERTENRVLTPTRYRNNAKKCDSSTQTENPAAFCSARSSSEISETRDKYLKEKMSQLELRRETRRSRSESVVERPKWGANRPPTRYMKQSEKDPVYQRRKLRQKREGANKSYDEKNSSDDDSQSGTPVRYRKKDLSEKRHMRARWRKEEKMFNGKVKMYQREIVPLESNKDHLYLKCHRCNCSCARHKCCEETKVDILRIEDEPTRLPYDIDDRRPDGESVDVLNKLSSLQNGLMLEQEKWDRNSPRSPTPSPPVE